MLIVAATSTAHGVVLDAHQGFARAVLIYGVITALWGFFLFLRKANPSGGYLGALIIFEGLTILQGVVGLGLVAQGHRPHDSLHFLYGVVAVVTLPTAYFLSDNGTTRRDSLIFGVACLFLFGVGIRGIATGGT